MLTLIIAFPLFAALLLLCVPREREHAIKSGAIAAGAIWLILMMVLACGFNFEQAGTMQFVGQGKWLDLGNNGAIVYHLGIDGLSLPLLLLTSILMLVSLIYSAATIRQNVKAYFVLFLLLGVGLAGTFCALDFFLFYIFWELAMLPMYFLIGIWGGARRRYASIKFFIYTSVGSFFMLLAIIYLYFQSGQTGARTDDMLLLMARGGPAVISGSAAVLCFWAFTIAFAVKVPAFPFHTWLPDAHVEAPTAGSVMLAGAMLKMGTYGLARISLGLFPQQAAEYAEVFLMIGLIGLIYGSLCALAQSDMKKLVAYSSVGHMGFVLLGLGAASLATFPAGMSAENIQLARITALNGAVLQMVNHGLITGALFLLVGVIYERAHHRDINRLGGLMANMPRFGGLFIFMGMASLGLPGLTGFWGEFFALGGTFQLARLTGAIGAVGIVLTAAYFLLLIQRVIMGPTRAANRGFPDLLRAEQWSLYPLALLILLFGLWPGPLIQPINIVSRRIVATLDQRASSLSQLPSTIQEEARR